MSTEEIQGSISFCLAMLKKGDQAAAQRLWAAVLPSPCQPGPLASPSRAPRQRRRGGRCPEHLQEPVDPGRAGKIPPVGGSRRPLAALVCSHRPEGCRPVEARTREAPRWWRRLLPERPGQGPISSGLSAPSRRPSSPPSWPRSAGGCSRPWATRHWDVSPSGRWRATPTRKSPRNSGWSSRPSSASSAGFATSGPRGGWHDSG